MDTNLPVVGKLTSGQLVIERFKLHKHSGMSPELLSSTLNQVDAQGRPFFVEVVEFDEVVGKSICVATNDKDVIVYARRPGRPELSRFVLKREAEPSHYVTVILKAGDPPQEDVYVLVTSFIGGKSQPEPWDERALSKEGPNAFEQSIRFWSNHALVLGEELLECFQCGYRLKYGAKRVHQTLLCRHCLDDLCTQHKQTNPRWLPKQQISVPGWGEITVPQLSN